VTGCGVEPAIEDTAIASDRERRAEFKAKDDLLSLRN